MYQRFFLSLLLLVTTHVFISCNDSDGKSDVPEETKEFVLFDALAYYAGKPEDLTADKLSQMTLIYENNLINWDPTDVSKIFLDMNKVTAEAEAAAQKGIKFVCTDIETWYNDDGMGADSLKNNFVKMYDVFRAKMAGVQVSNYGVPFTNLNRSRYNSDGSKKTHADDEILQRWKDASQKRYASVSAMDYLCPSVYLAMPDIASWAYDLRTTVNECKKLDKSKKVYVYMWPQYYDLADGPYNKVFIDPADWKRMLEHAFKYCDGVVLWAHPLDNNGNWIEWSDPRVQAMFSATKEFIAEHAENIKVMK
jgi:hypothetical protein